jgi:hypothetical protein
MEAIMQRIFQPSRVRRSLLLAAACLMLAAGPAIGEGGQGMDTLFSLRHDGRGENTCLRAA